LRKKTNTQQDTELRTVNERVPEYPDKKTLDCHTQKSIRLKKDG